MTAYKSQANENDALTIIKPNNISFGQKLDVATNMLKSLCKKLTSLEIKPAQIPNTKIRQIQLDCHGYNYAGKERLAEFVFKDDELFLVWILVNRNELASLEKSMLKKYNNANYNNDLFAGFTQHNTALRKDIPEVLFYAPQASEQFEMWFKSSK